MGQQLENGRGEVEYLHILEEMDLELQRIIIEYNNRRLGIVGKENLVAIWKEENAVLEQKVKDHARLLKFIMGEPYEPVAHVAEGVLIGVGGGGML